MTKRLILALISGVTLVSYSTLVYAEPLGNSGDKNTVIISELQVNGSGTGTTTNEFIELYNNSDTSADVSGWSVIYRNSSDKDVVLFTFSQDTAIAARSFIVGKNAATAASYMPEVGADFVYSLPSYGLPASSGTVLIKDSQFTVIDEVSWSSDAKYIDDATINDLKNGLSIQRSCVDEQTLVTNGTPITSYYVDTPSPLSLHCQLTSTDTSDEPATSVTNPDNNDVEPDVQTQTPSPQPDRLRLPIYINELFIDPESPLTDASDEYVELYNPNDEQIDLAGYVIIAGSTTKYRYQFPAGAVIAPKSYIAITSAATTISLSNSGATVELLNDLQQQIDIVTYAKANTAEAWARNSSGEWQWTTSPTMAAPNIITIRPPAATATKPVKKAAATAKTVKKTTKAKTNFSIALPIQLNEIFPNPASPQTDANDEFIELYNPHPMAINITDYTIIVNGDTKQYKYTFPEGSVIAPGGYIAIDSANTSISLINDGATVRLINNFEKEIDSVSYSKAPSGQSYARNELGNWQWTSSVTKLAENTITQGDSKMTSTEVAGASTKNSSYTDIKPAPQPLPSWALAVLGVAAVCYAAYEYRFEVRNSINKFRENRTAG